MRQVIEKTTGESLQWAVVDSYGDVVNTFSNRRIARLYKNFMKAVDTYLDYRIAKLVLAK